MATRNASTPTINYEGAPVHALAAIDRLYARVSTSLMGEDRFYETGKAADDALIADLALVAATEPEFPLQLAAYARHELRLRSTPAFVLAFCSLLPNCRPFIRAWTPVICRRVDDVTETLAAWDDLSTPGTVPAQLKLGLADALARFDVYQLLKYDRGRGSTRWTIGDALGMVDRRLTRPLDQTVRNYLVTHDSGLIGQIPRLDARRRLLNRPSLDAEALAILDDENPAVTWESLVSNFGGKAEVWAAIAPRMGYMGLLRNLRGMCASGMDMGAVCARLADPAQARRSMQLPFRFLSARRMLQAAADGWRPGRDGWRETITPVHVPQEMFDALDAALEATIVNLPLLGGTSAVAVDESGSMGDNLSAKSVVTRKDAGNVLAALVTRRCERGVVFAFGSTAQLVPSHGTILEVAERMASAQVGHLTNAHLVVEQMTESLEVVDRLIILSDVQVWNTMGSWSGHHYRGQTLSGAVAQYRAQINPDLRVYSIDMAGYGTAAVDPADPRTLLVAGWSERVLELFKHAETGPGVALDHIRRLRPEMFAPREQVALTAGV